ncbi:MAG: radical SAM protein [Candidatus Hadarchaeales archaeon]
MGPKKNRFGSFVVGEMPEGCRLCVRGAKLVLFLTGLCQRSCFYCPLSSKRRGKDVVYANERPIRSTRQLLEEAELMDALGTGITGGDPSLRFRRLLRYLRALKRGLGPEHHVHLYCMELSRERLRRLREEGLDELRLHTWSPEPVRKAVEEGLNCGVELPSLPGSFRVLSRLLGELEKVGCSFVNLNELEFSETNSLELRKRGFRLKSLDSVAVKGSEELALKVLEWASENTDLNLHYCPSRLKDGVQLRNRLRRRARKVARPYEALTPDGLLVKGVIEGLSPNELEGERRRLMRKYGIPPELLSVNRRRGRLETSTEIAEKLSELEEDLSFSWVESYPTFDGVEVTVIPLPLRGRGTRETSGSP